MLLENHAAVESRSRDRLPIQRHGTAILPFQARDDLQQRRFAAAGMSDDDKELAIVHIEVHAFQDAHRLAVHIETFVYVMKGKTSGHTITSLSMVWKYARSGKARRP